MPQVRSVSLSDPVTVVMSDGQSYSATHAQIAALPGNLTTKEGNIKTAILSKLANHGVWVHIFTLSPFDAAVLLVDPGQPDPPANWWERVNPVVR
jgi:hypothetical protein